MNPDVVNLWTTLGDTELTADLTERLAAIPYSRSVFEAAQKETGGTPLDRAVRFLVRCRFSRGGVGTSFAWSDARGAESRGTKKRLGNLSGTAKGAYGAYEMSQLQHFWLVAALRAHSGPAAISGYRCPEYDRWLHDWRRHDFEMPNNAGQSKRKQRRMESLWINW